MVSQKTAATNNAEMIIYNCVYSDNEFSRLDEDQSRNSESLNYKSLKLLQSTMEFPQIATAKFITKCDRQPFCNKVRHSLRIATDITKCNNYYKLRQPSCSVCLKVRQSHVSILKGIEILNPIKWSILQRASSKP